MPSEIEPPELSPGPLESLSDRMGASPASIVGTALAVVAAAAAAWWALRAPDPPPVESVLPVAGTVEVAIPPPTTTEPPPVVVHVDGEVARPGVHELAPGARVVDAVEVAGGLTDDADRARVNLAAPVRDGERLWIPAVGDEEPRVVAGEGDATRSGDADGPLAGPVDLNLAAAAELEQLPGIGPSLAAAIVDHRQRDGPFSSVDGLLAVSGIGPAKLAGLRDLVTV